MGGMGKMAAVSAGANVKVKAPGPVPEWSTWDEDGQRTSNHVKRRLQQLFFRGDRRVRASVVYISSESQRERLKSKKQVKLELRDPAGSTVVIIADPTNLVVAA